MTKKNNPLLDKLKSIGVVKSSDVLSDSVLFNDVDMVQTDVPALNIALSGSVSGGLTPGLTIVAGPSRTFKTNMSLKMVSAYQKKYADAVCLFYDSEYGVTPEYLEAMDVDSSRIIHIPIEDMEQLKFDLVQKLKQIERGNKVIILIDSIGNLASKKEADDAEKENGAADMGIRAKGLKSLFRIITPHLRTKDIPCIAINHSYKEMALYPKEIMSGGQGPLLAANTVIMVSRSQEKNKDNEIEGYTFSLNIEKSRFVRERSRIPLTVMFDEGIDKYSGLLDIALEGEFITQPTKQTYLLVGETDAVKKKNIEPYLEKLLSMPEFNEYIKKTYRLTAAKQYIKPNENDSEEE